MGPQSWSIIIFCYNEEGSVGSVVQDAVSVMEQIAPVNYEILVINDGSTDGTYAQVEKLIRKYDKIRVINHEYNLGIGGALRSGYFNAQFENVCSVPADGQFNLYELLPYTNVPLKTIISFYRTAKISYSSYRTILSYVNRKINRYILGLKMFDVNWVKIYKLEELKKIDIQMHSSLIETEICAKLVIHSNSLVQVPSSYKSRISGKVKGSSLIEIKRISKELYTLIRIVKKFKKKCKNQT